MNDWYSLAAAMAGAPTLHDAKCVGRAEFFDPPEAFEDPHDVQYRHHHALRLCASCPALEPCGEWLRSLKPSKRPVGVVAGQLIDQHTKRIAA